MSLNPFFQFVVRQCFGNGKNNKDKFYTEEETPNQGLVYTKYILEDSSSTLKVREMKESNKEEFERNFN